MRERGSNDAKYSFICSECIRIHTVQYSLQFTHHRFNFLVKEVNLACRAKYRGKISAANRFLLSMTNPIPCGSHRATSWFRSSDSISMSWGYVCVRSRQRENERLIMCTCCERARLQTQTNQTKRKHRIASRSTGRCSAGTVPFEGT